MSGVLTVGVDGRELVGEPTGVGRYVAELLKRWATMAEGVRFIVYVPANALSDVSLASTELMSVKPVPGSGVWWEQVELPKAANHDDLDRFFAPAYTAPLRVRAPIVLTIHDISYVAHPEWFGTREGLRRRLLTRWSARVSTVILTDTEFSRSEIVRLLDVPASRVRVITLGIDSAAPRVEQGAREPLVLFVGSILERRHVPDLIRAFARVARRHGNSLLAIVGSNRTSPRQELATLARNLGVTNRVSIRDYVSNAELGDLYGRASVFAFLSEYEGFGFTPLEALAAGVPVVVLDTPVAREVCGDAAVYVSSPDDEHAVAEALESLLYDSRRRERVLAQVADVLSRYSWERTARQTLDAIVAAPAPPLASRTRAR